MRNALSLWKNRNPFGEMLSLQRDLDRFFDDGFTRFPSTSIEQEWKPQASVSEDDSTYHVKVDLPGVTKDNVKVDYNDGYLTISGERREEKKTDNEREHYSEVFFGSFVRTFNFPQVVDPEKISAKYENGVLTVDLAKAAKAQTRQISVK